MKMLKTSDAQVFYRDHISLRVPGDEYKCHDFKAPIQEDFKFYTMDLSYFSGKLEMYFRYKGISFCRIEPTAQEFESILSKNTGTEQLPQVYDNRAHIPDSNRWLRDTTPIIEYLERDKMIAMNSLLVIPSCPVQAFFQRLIEDYADEYLWRPAMFWRWEPEFDRQIMGIRFSWEFARTTPLRFRITPMCFRPFLLTLRQWLLSSWGEDCVTQAKKEVVKQQYYELLDILEEILSQQPYLFGNRPTLVDFGFAGPFFRHFSSDFTPRKVMQQRAPAVYEWVARLWNCKSSKMVDPSGFPIPGELPSNWTSLLALLPDYLEYYHLNAIAHSSRASFFHWPNKGEVFHVPTVPYRAWCRRQLQKHFDDSPLEAKSRIEQLLREHGLWDLLWAGGRIDVEPECGTEPPFALYPPPPRGFNSLTYKWDPNQIFGHYLVGIALQTLFYGTAATAIFRVGLDIYTTHRLTGR